MGIRTRSSLLAALALLTTASHAGAAEGYVVVVNAAHDGNAISRETLSALFLREATRWGDGTDVQVVDQSLKSEVRAAFSSDALGMTPLAVMNHWHQELRAGRSRRPPRVKETDAEVVEFVAGDAGAIGYVSVDAPLDSRVKALSIVN